MAPRTFLKPQLLTFNGEAVSDHNRAELSIDFNRIETSARMADGTLRKYVVATKHEFSVTWSDLPNTSDYTIDGFWGGRDLYDFYKEQVGPFWMTVVHGDGIIESYFVMIDDFSYSLTKRGLYDFWDLDIKLVEV